MAAGVFNAFKMKQALMKLAAVNPAMMEVVRAYDDIESRSVEMATQMRRVEHSASEATSKADAQTQNLVVKVGQLEATVSERDAQLLRFESVAQEIAAFEQLVENLTQEADTLRAENSAMTEIMGGDIVKNLQEALAAAQAQRATELERAEVEYNKKLEHERAEWQAASKVEMGKLKKQVADGKRGLREAAMELQLLKKQLEGMEEAKQSVERLAKCEEAKEEYRQEGKSLQATIVELKQRLSQSQSGAAGPRSAATSGGAVGIACARCERTLEAAELHCAACCAPAAPAPLRRRTTSTISGKAGGADAAIEEEGVEEEEADGAPDDGLVVAGPGPARGDPAQPPGGRAEATGPPPELARAETDKEAQKLRQVVKEKDEEIRQLNMVLQELRNKLADFHTAAGQSNIRLRVDGMLESVGITADIIHGDGVRAVFDRLYKDALRRQRKMGGTRPARPRGEDSESPSPESDTLGGKNKEAALHPCTSAPDLRPGRRKLHQETPKAEVVNFDPRGLPPVRINVGGINRVVSSLPQVGQNRGGSVTVDTARDRLGATASRFGVGARHGPDKRRPVKGSATPLILGAGISGTG
mmetsp:Transcript_47341/g.107403  ORF Transcript_47341/g.107403 Transcript_47341/m.107403 type:complete len:588 (+) Transcript_47341:116-1879(+)